MAKLLLDERPLQVLPGLACAVGLNEAMVLQQLHWIRQNPAMGKEVDGKKWIRMTYKEWRVGHFPFWSEATIQRAFESLEGREIVLSRDDLNHLSFDRTKWYAIDDDAVQRVEESFEKNERIVEHSKMIDAHRKMKNASSQNETTIPDTSSTQNSVADKQSDTAAAPAAFEKIRRELENALGVFNPTHFRKLVELWQRFPDPRRHDYAYAKLLNSNPRRFDFYLTDYAGFDPTRERTWGNALPSPTAEPPDETEQYVARLDVLESFALPNESISDELTRLLAAGRITEAIYHATSKRYCAGNGHGQSISGGALTAAEISAALGGRANPAANGSAAQRGGGAGRGASP